MSQTARLGMVSRPHPHFSIVEQCALLKVPRSTLYYKPKPVSDDDLNTSMILSTVRKYGVAIVIKALMTTSATKTSSSLILKTFDIQIGTMDVLSFT